jgi:hypothetical protein
VPGNVSRAPRVPVCLCLAAILAAAVTGCTGGHLAQDPALDANRASWVQTSIIRSMSLGAMTEEALTQIVFDDGGGYVTRIQFTGQRGTSSQQTIMDTVLGIGPVHNPPPGETVNSPDGRDPIACYQFTIGWTDTAVPRPVREGCPEANVSWQQTQADTEADKINSAAGMAAAIAIPAAAVPGTRRGALNMLQGSHAYALKLLGQVFGRNGASDRWTYALEHQSFAPGRDLAATALPVLGGGCVYVSFIKGEDSHETDPAWSAPLEGPCTGAAALAASGPISYDPRAGG